MKISCPKCPECGGLAIGTLEELEAWARLDFDDNGEAEYSGYTEVIWETQRTVVNIEDETVTLECEAGHQWRSKMDQIDP
jgi:hypothetical protein